MSNSEKNSNIVTKKVLREQLRDAILWGEHPEVWVSDNKFATKLSQTDWDLDSFAVRLIYNNDGHKIDFINDLLKWKSLDLYERREVGLKMYDWLLERQGIYGISHIYNKSNDPCYGYSYNDRIQINEESCLVEQNPYTLFATLAHELQHRKQRLHNTLCKKGDNKVYWNNLYLIQQDLTEDPQEVRAIYDSSLMELDARQEEVYALAALRSKMLEIGSPQLLQEAKKVEQLINDTEEEIAFETISDVEFYGSHRKSLRNMNKAIKNYQSGIIDDFRQAAAENQLAEYVNSAEGLLGLSYIFTDLNPSQAELAEITSTLLQGEYLASIAAVNNIKYNHNKNELNKVCTILHNCVGTAILTPVALKYLSHIPANEIREACANVIGQDKVDLQMDAIKDMYTKKLQEFPSLFACDYSDNGDWTPLSPDDPNTYSTFLSNVYPNFTLEFVDEFSQEYKAAILRKVCNNSSDKIREIFLAKKDFADSSAKLDKSDLTQFDYTFNNSRIGIVDEKYRKSSTKDAAKTEDCMER